LDDFSRKCLLEGLDDVALTLQQEDALAAYEASHAAPISTLALS
jgi:3-isopropylmalate/(R)-2-methylmalate dehydratase small subunit